MKLSVALRWLLAGLALAGGILFVLSHSGSGGPNVLLITLDTTRADHIGCYGADTARTPVLDQLAADGVLFERCYTPVPLTLPSHATILTGLYPPEHGLRINGMKSLDPDIPAMAEQFDRHGYRTSAFIASYVLNARFGLNRGFSHYDDDVTNGEKGEPGVHQLRSARQIVDASLDWLGSDTTGGDPFFCWVHIVDPHMPCQEHADEFGSDFSGNAYAAEIAYADQQIGRLIALLEQQNRLQNTIVVIAGDHGEGLGEHGEAEHGYMVYESTMHVPLIFRVPNLPIPSRGKRVRQVASLVDLYPTILKLVGLPSGDSTGTSGQNLFSDAFTGENDSRGVYGESDAPLLEAGWSSLRSITTTQWKYIRTQRPELFDLASDPKELNNLAEQNPDLLNRLDERLMEIEAGMKPRDTEATNLTLQSSELRALESLGYVGRVSDPAAAVARRDIKDVIRYPDLLEKSMGLISGGKLEEASVILEDIVENVPDYARALGTLGVCRASQGRREEAVTYFRQSLKYDAPNRKPVHGNNKVQWLVVDRVHFAVFGTDKRLQSAELRLRRTLLGVHGPAGNAHARWQLDMEKAKARTELPVGSKRGGIFSGPTGSGVYAVANGTMAVSNYLGVCGKTLNWDCGMGSLWPFTSSDNMPCQDRSGYEGIFYNNSRTRIGDITDGTSNTCAVGERGQNSSLSYGWPLCGRGYPPLYSGRKDHILEMYLFSQGVPSDNPDSGPSNQKYWSWHAGGSQFTMADGSVQFFSYSMDTNIYQALGTRSGGEVIGQF